MNVDSLPLQCWGCRETDWQILNSAPVLGGAAVLSFSLSVCIREPTGHSQELASEEGKTVSDPPHLHIEHVL